MGFSSASAGAGPENSATQTTGCPIHSEVIGPEASQVDCRYAICRKFSTTQRTELLPLTTQVQGGRMSEGRRGLRKAHARDPGRWRVSGRQSRLAAWLKEDSRPAGCGFGKKATSIKVSSREVCWMEDLHGRQKLRLGSSVQQPTAAGEPASPAALGR